MSVVTYTDIEFFANPDYLRMANFLGLSRDSREDLSIAEKVDFLAEWARRKTNSDNQTDWMIALKDLQKKLGLNVRGRTLVNELFKYTRLSLQKEDLEKQMVLIGNQKQEKESKEEKSEEREETKSANEKSGVEEEKSIHESDD